ncbi:MAG: DegV family protein, partial [Collinsella sp.]|nr:DegV family protein [Collinsella sp.]
MSWALISDSSCNLRDWQPTAPHTTFAFAPLKIRVGEREFVDDLSLDVHELNVAIQSESSASSSSCPSVGEWAELFKLADKTICMPISEGVSGSYNAAATARDMVLAEEPNRKIHLVNSRAAGGKMDLIFLLFDRYLASKPDASFEEACAYFDSLEQNSKILFSLCNYENLAKAGRIPKAAGVIANKLNIRILGTASDAGEIELVGHTRGEKKMLNKIVDTMEAEGFMGGEVIIDHVENEAGAQALADRIVEHWPGSKTIIMPCNGLDSYYAEMHGLIIGYG